MSKECFSSPNGEHELVREDTTAPCERCVYCYQRFNVSCTQPFFGTLIPVLLVLLLGACASPFVAPYVQPYQPPYVVDPVLPIEPIEPQPPSDTAIPYSLVEQVLPEMLVAEVTSIVGRDPTERPSETENRKTWDYGECVDKDGEKRTLYVVTDDAGVVLNRVLL